MPRIEWIGKTPRSRSLLWIRGERKLKTPLTSRDLDLDLDLDLELVCGWRARRGHSSSLLPLRLRMRGIGGSSWRWRWVVFVVVLGLSERFVSQGSALKPSCLSTMCYDSLALTMKKLCLEEGCCDGDNRCVLEKEDRLGSKFHCFVFVLAPKNHYIVVWKLPGSEFAFHFGIHHIHPLYFISSHPR